MKLIHVIGLMICLSILCVLPVFALETLQDDVTTPSYYVSTNYYAANVGGAYGVPRTLTTSNIESTKGTSALIHFDDSGWVSTYSITEAYNETPFVATTGGTTIGTGVVGYQRSFNALGGELPGYQYLVFTSWDIGTLVGAKVITLTYDTSFPLLTLKTSTGGWSSAPATGYFVWSGGDKPTGTTTWNKRFEFENSYSVTKGAGFGTVGTVWKYSLAHGDTFLSQAFVINATSGTVVTSDSGVTSLSLHFDTPTESIVIAILDSEGTWHNTTTLFSVASPSSSVYSININPSTLTLPGYVAGTLVGTGSDLAKVTDIDWSWADGTGAYDFYEGGNTSRPLSYTKVGSTWYGYEVGFGGLGGAYSRNKGTAFLNPVTLSNISSSGTKIVTCFIGTSDGYWYTLTGSLTVAQGGMQTFIVEATDAQSNALVSYADISVLDKSTGLWSNVTSSGGTYNYLFQYNSNLQVEAIATGYARTQMNWTILPYPSYIFKIPMYPTGSIAAANVSLNVVVLEGSTSGVFPNAQVRLNDGQVKTTTGAGVANFNVSATKQYQIIASYTGYNSATRTLTTGAGGTSQDTYLTLNRIVVTTAPTLAPGVTAQVTLDTRTNAQKDQGMMDQIRGYADLLIPVACFMTLLYMFGYKA